MFKSAKLYSQILILYGLANVATSGSKFSWPLSSFSCVNGSQLFGMTQWYKHEWFLYIYFAVLTLLYIQTQIWYFFPGNIATVRSYIAAATFTEERTAQMSIASSFQSVGFTLGPGIQAALTPFKCTDVGAEDSQYLSFDMYTSAG